MKINIKEWLINWLIENVGMDETEILEHMEDNFFELGWIDSYTFIGFITDLESVLNRKFSNEELNSEAFMTLKGLIKMIEMEEH